MKFLYKLLALQRLAGEGRLLQSYCWGRTIKHKKYNRDSFRITSPKWASRSVFSFE